jgi:predicted GNAT family acetyltransferase
MSDLAVFDNPAQHRFELHDGDKIAFLSYRLHPAEIILIHTEVPKELGGRGIGGKLAQAALDSARARNLKVKAPCPFVSGWIQKHPEYSDLL